jgi:hypothetical protein
MCAMGIAGALAHAVKGKLRVGSMDKLERHPL